MRRRVGWRGLLYLIRFDQDGAELIRRLSGVIHELGGKVWLSYDIIPLRVSRSEMTSYRSPPIVENRFTNSKVMERIASFVKFNWLQVLRRQIGRWVEIEEVSVKQTAAWNRQPQSAATLFGYYYCATPLSQLIRLTKLQQAKPS
jgi:hypothetical protein